MKYFNKARFTKFLTFCLLSLFFLFSLNGCDEGDSSHSYSSTHIGLNGFTEEEQLSVKISHETCNVGSTISLAVTCRDAGGALLKDIEVLFSSDNGGKFSETNVKTDDYGSAGTSFTPEKEGTSLISINAHGISKQITLQVYPSPNETYFILLAVSSEVLQPGQNITVSVLVYNSSNIGVKEAEVNLSCQYGTITETTGKTDERGFFSTTYKAPDSVGVDTIVAVSLTKKDQKNVSVQ